MTSRRASVDADQVHRERLERARGDLQAWGRWLTQRTSGALGYGQSTLANLIKVDGSTEGYRAPINEAHCSWVDDAVNSLPADVRVHAKLHFGHGFSYRFIATRGRCAPQTVSRSIELAIRTVAYWGANQPSAALEA